jgi:transmembrane sensor
MQKEETYYKLLVSGFIDKKLSVEQVKELFEFIKQHPEKYDSIMNLPEIREKLNEKGDNINLDVSDVISKRIWERLSATVDSRSEKIATPVHRIHLLRRSWFRYAAAAVLLIGVATIAIVVSSDRQSQKSDQSLASGNKQLQTDALPGKNGAILTLADGSKLLLDSLGNGVVTTQGKTTVLIRNGQLVYNASAKQNEVLYNTMTTPKGRQYQLVLPDGSQVWLNAASSITYPTVFAGKDRTVTITGEAYFEVAKDKSKPFHVKVNEIEVEVLGTHFNINSYADEAGIKTTLLEGSVKVISGATTAVAASSDRQHKSSGTDDFRQSIVIKPGQQAIANSQQLSVVNDADIDQVMAWKNGMFNFSKVSLQEVMRQISRWYDVEIEYQGTIQPKKFGGEIQRDLNLSEVLDGLKETGIHFRIEGKKLIVLP